MSADPTTVLLPRVVAPRAPLPREARVKVLQFGPALDVRGGISSVEQLICDYLPPYASIRHVATMTEGSKLTNAAVFARADALAVTLARRHRSDHRAHPLRVARQHAAQDHSRRTWWCVRGGR